jgi:hypothetical protein
VLAATLTGSENQRVKDDLPTETLPPFGGSERVNELWADAEAAPSNERTAKPSTATKRHRVAERLRVIP